MLKGIMKLNKQDGVDVAALTAELTNTKEMLETTSDLVTELQSKLSSIEAAYEEAKAALEELQEVKAKLVAEAAEKRLKARKEKIEASVGTSKVDSLMSATESLSDEQFEAVVSAMSASAEKEASSQMFTEAGATVEVDASKVQEEDELKRLLTEKYVSK